ncbi:ArnT family glycosyltransferase [Ktedonobacter robiniae]|uniref:Glycosyltransferase RgtA/B/C/D-like domain-containing protein n=1 Tax=Ktedonobacter robiniae TaxID=2778365 RepID=A0ABQ3UWS1_9CHLR|nr:glycosyltransferase family 39 protein [Ktedonobacter robiniae]GHO56840.1 hypothetical protein KSB_53150 [Ktedonobacter robiniae]
MSLTSLKPQVSDEQAPPAKGARSLLTWLKSWELYVILLLAILFRFYLLNTTSFMDDEAIVFRMAHDAFAHGLFPVTSNRASLGNLNFPLVEYIFMLPAAFSADPLGGEILVALFNVVAIFLSYFFTRKYYGRLAAILVALLYVTSVMARAYSQNIWQQNLMPPLIMLFFFCLFRGVVTRRGNWLFPALVLLGLLYQLHGSSLLLVIPLLVACVLAYKTIRWHEIVLAALVILLIITPFIYWEFQNNFQDIQILLNASKRTVQFDTQTIDYYQYLFSAYFMSPALRVNHLPNYPTSVLVSTPLHYLQRPLRFESEKVMPLLFLVSAVSALISVIWSPRKEQATQASQGIKGQVWSWLKNFWVSPARQGLLLLLIWQIILPLTLLRRSIPLYPHYYIMYLPGQFILIAIFVVRVVKFLQQYRSSYTTIARFSLLGFVVLILFAQTLGISIMMIDTAQGRFDAHAAYPGYENLSSMQSALNEADQFARAHHIQRIYISTTFADGQSLRYLAEQLHTPTTLYGSTMCTVLPGSQAGSVLYIADPRNAIQNQLIQQYTHATLVARPPRLGEQPYNMYLLTAQAEPAPVAGTFSSNLKALSSSAQVLHTPDNQLQWLSTRWQVQQTQPAAARTFYNTQFLFNPAGLAKDNPTCQLTALNRGDQIFTQQAISTTDPIPTALTFQVQTNTSVPVTRPLGPLTLTTYDNVLQQVQTLQTTTGQQSVTMPVVTR